MPAHPLVTQLRFARSEFVRCLQGVSAEDAVRRLMPMNCISWVIGHLANQENRYWLLFPGGENRFPALNELVGFGKPATTPPLAQMWETWHAITSAADLYLDGLTVARLQEHYIWNGKAIPENIGTLLQRNIYHYWFHTGEAHAIRQMLGHPDLPQFVGDLSVAPYTPE